MAGNAIKNDFIYIVLVKAHTGLGKVSRVLSGGYEYSHIAVCKDDRFEDFITFSRRRHYAPFDAGFMHETRGCYCFGTHDRVKLKVFRLPIDLRAKREVYHFLRHVERQQDKYLFNLYSMVTMPVLHGFIRALDTLLAPYLYTERYFSDRSYWCTSDRGAQMPPGYMDRVSLRENIRLFLRLNKRLLSRIRKGGRDAGCHI